MARQRVEWVDIAKGICIIFVVMVHAALGVEKAMDENGWLHQVVSFARPFRMPDFFLISGLFLGLVIDRPWRVYVDRKIVHFAYFYILWLTIQFVFKAPAMASAGGWAAPVQSYLTAFVQPFGTLWFIYLLPLFFVATRIVRKLPATGMVIVAAVLEILPVATGIVVVDEFCARYVYFFIGYAFAGSIFALATRAAARPGPTLALVALWVLINAALVFTPAPAALSGLVQGEFGHTGATGGFSELPIISLALGLTGSMVVVCVSALLSQLPFTAWLKWLGGHSIVVYLAFFLPMAIARTLVVKSGLAIDAGTAGALVTAAGVAGAVACYGCVQWSGWGGFLFRRPAWASLDRSAVAPSRSVPAQ